MEQTYADEAIIYLTADTRTVVTYNRYAKTYGYDRIELIPNYRLAIATVKEYKATRKPDKPAHYDNLTSHIMNNYKFELANGLEADDLMAMAQNDDTIICSRDKDLRQVPGAHYSWECGRQAEVGPLVFSPKGYIEEKGNGKKEAFGGGEMFFLYQLIVGDVVDNIPGCPKAGHVKAMKLLLPEEPLTRKQSYEAVRGCYSAVYGEDDLTHLEEQGRLLWLLREKDQVWEYPYKEADDDSLSS